MSTNSYISSYEVTGGNETYRGFVFGLRKTLPVVVSPPPASDNIGRLIRKFGVVSTPAVLVVFAMTTWNRGWNDDAAWETFRVEVYRSNFFHLFDGFVYGDVTVKSFGYQCVGF